MNGNYPTMSEAEWEDAPFNEDTPQEVDVTVSITISKPVTLIMRHGEEYTQKELSNAAYDQMQLASILKEWDIDDFTVTEE